MKTEYAIGNLSSVQYLQRVFFDFSSAVGARDSSFASTSIPIHINRTWKMYYSARANHDLVLLNSLLLLLLLLSRFSCVRLYVIP